MVSKDDVKFRKWVAVVSPDDHTESAVLFSIDWMTILKILLQIFEILLGLGCFAASRATSKVRAAMSHGLNSQTEELLRGILSDLQQKQKRKDRAIMRSLVFILALLPMLAHAKGGVQVDAKGHAFLFSPKYQKKFYLGLKPHAKQTSEPDKKYLNADVKVPNDFDLRTKWPLPPGLPYDQGQCGSCVVNSINGNVTYNLSIRGQLPQAYSPLSRGQTMECNPSAGQCDGDYAENVGGWVSKHGHLLPESVYSYRAYNGSCRNISGQEYGPVPAGRVIDNSPESIGKALVSVGAVSTTVGADNTWMNAGTGVYKSCTRQGTNHEVLIIGIHATGSARGADGFIDFASAKPGDLYIDILNSWGTQWADGGVIHTLITDSRGNLCNNVTEEIYAFDWAPLAPPVDGHWSDWGACVNGQQSRTCTNPAPSNGGKDCEGLSVQPCVIPPPPPVPESDSLPVLVWLLFVTLAGLAGFVVGRASK
jgi:hypothetical protein